MTFTDDLRADVGDIWDAVVHHPFTDALADGTLDPSKMRRYLIQDHRFIDRFVVLLASAVAHAPTLTDRIPGCQFLALVTGPENTYFERAFVALGTNEADRAAIPDAPVTAQFKELMHDTAASGSYARMLAVLTVAEWSYLSWANRVIVRLGERRPTNFWHAEWIDLHSGAYFESVIAWLRDQLDTVGPVLEDAERAQVCCDFTRAVELEKEFFDHAWK